MKSILFMLSALLVSAENGFAKELPKGDAGHKTVIIDIPADLPPPASAEEVMKNHPFFAAPSSAHEVMEKVEELEGRIEKLEKSVSQLEKGKS